MSKMQQFGRTKHSNIPLINPDLDNLANTVSQGESSLLHSETAIHCDDCNVAAEFQRIIIVCAEHVEELMFSISMTSASAAAKLSFIAEKCKKQDGG